MSLTTPMRRSGPLQRKLYRKAKAEPAFRFYVLYDKIYREDILRHAYGLARGNAGAPGVDGVSFAQIEAAGLEAWLAGLREELRLEDVPARSGAAGDDPEAGVEASDRSAFQRSGIGWSQTAAKLVLEPIFEADFEDNAYGYRPARGAVDAIKEVHRLHLPGLHRCGGCRSFQVLRFDSARRADSNRWPGRVVGWRPCCG